MIRTLRRGLVAITLTIAPLSVIAVHAQPTVIPLPPPPLTNWAPEGCRTVPIEHPVLPGRETWTNMHGDSLASDQIERVIGPMLVQDWTAESATYNPTGPTFDRNGNLYFSPLSPYEDVVMISLDPADGSRRWSIAGTSAAMPGGSPPIVLDDPNNPGQQLVYLALYDRALAVQPDGTIVWDAPTGLVLPPDPLESTVLGINYATEIDAIVGVTMDGHVYALDRATGASLLTSIFELPGERSPDSPSLLPPATLAAAEDAWQVLVDLPDGGLDAFVNVVLGQDVEVANTYAADPNTGRLWIAATAPDAEDGTVDGLSEFGALFGLDIVPDGAQFEIIEACHASYDGGSASTPALNADGTVIYVGDNFGKLLAISAEDCSIHWELDLGQQIVGSIAVSSDNDVVYASSRDFITEVFDRGAFSETGWVAGINGLFENLEEGQVEFNLNLTSIGASGLGFQAGAGIILADVPFAVSVGVGVIDRADGSVRHFTPAPEETVAVMTSAGDGAVYLGNSPVRRAFAIGLGISSDPLVGGVTKFKVARHDLLARDAVCVAQVRAANAAANAATCPDSATADGRQLLDLIAQTTDIAIPQALANAELTASKAAVLESFLADAQSSTEDFVANGTLSDLEDAGAKFGAACSAFGVCPASRRSGCKAAQKSVVTWKIKDGAAGAGSGEKDKLIWKWNKGDALSLEEIADPTNATDFGLCVYTGSTPTLAAGTTIPADPNRWQPTGTKGFQFKDKAKPPTDGGVAKVKAKSGEAGKSGVKIVGKGQHLPDLAFPVSGSLTVQLSNRDTGACISSTWEDSDFKKNKTSLIKGNASP